MPEHAVMARRGRPRRCASVAKLVDEAENEEKEEKAKKLASIKEQQQTSSHHTEPATNATPRAATRKSVILTRAARRKAGIPPPTPLFRGRAKHSRTKTSSWQKQPSSSQSSSSGTSSSSSSDEDESMKPLWVQCDHRNCQKWRKLCPGTKIDIKENWYCSMHPDPAYQSCDTPEEKCQRSKKRGFTFSKLSAGQLVWARLKGFPPWPGVVSPDPWSDGDYISEYREGCIYHVEFLGKMRTHSWVPEEQVEPYHCQVLHCSLGEIRKSKRLEYALSEADSYATLSDKERLSKCEYTENAVKVEDSKPQTQVQNSTPNSSQNSQITGTVVSTTSSRRGRPSKATAALQASSQPLRDMTNQAATNSHTVGASSLISVNGAHEELVRTLGMGFNERNHINLVANTLIQQIQAEVLAALGQYATSTVTKTEPQRRKATASVQRATATIQPSTTSVRTSLRNRPSITAAQGTQALQVDPSSTQNIRVSPTLSRLTQTSLELSPDNQVKLVTTKQAPSQQKKVNRRQTSGKEKAKRKCRSPLAEAGSGKRAKRKGGAVDLVSPTIRDYFKTSDKSTNQAGIPQSIAKDQEVPIVTASSSAISEAGKTTFEFQSLEMEAESELQEIQTMLSMFDDIPATTLSDQDKPQNTHCHGHLTTTSRRQGSDEDRLSIVMTDQVSSGNCINESRVTAAGDDMDIESILHEMNTIDDLLQDLSQAQVVPY